MPVDAVSVWQEVAQRLAGPWQVDEAVVAVAVVVDKEWSPGSLGIRRRGNVTKKVKEGTAA